MQNDVNFYPGDRCNFLRNGRGLNFFRAGEAKIILSPNIYAFIPKKQRGPVPCGNRPPLFFLSWVVNDQATF
ncbi:MAG: hypothetical protein C4563_08960 [Desulfobulbus sp.]|nr:MAG: hypothetical protein C4563_08960 [Desulfobulbus sp.]